VRGEPAAGKTALLEYIGEDALGCYDYVAGKADPGFVRTTERRIVLGCLGRTALERDDDGPTDAPRSEARFPRGLILRSVARDELVLTSRRPASCRAPPGRQTLV
jgi:hypothetical protein